MQGLRGPSGSEAAIPGNGPQDGLGVQVYRPDKAVGYAQIQHPQMDQNQFSFTLISHLVSLTSFSVTFIFFPASVLDPHYLAFVNKTCSDAQNISFPFYIKDQQQSFCGFPGFELSCNNKGSPILGIPDSDNQYIIHHIFYNNQTLRVSNSTFWDKKSSTLGSGVIIVMWFLR
ncbi:hypothetical protein Ddye_030003 [Dipteronia dyeriana]|uniref:RING-type E3 ubiquitin transferase n=1 Tax=Dipteronia dyeriana TaxID=168575 RepID=A0AAD9TG86_9ROSI|nr:hypothetical protein Ddye_030003 [Dipteronia dyeriana]